MGKLTYRLTHTCFRSTHRRRKLYVSTHPFFRSAHVKEYCVHTYGVQMYIQRQDNLIRMKKLKMSLHEELNDILKKEELMWF